MDETCARNGICNGQSDADPGIYLGGIANVMVRKKKSERKAFFEK